MKRKLINENGDVLCTSCKQYKTVDNFPKFKNRPNRKNTLSHCYACLYARRKGKQIVVVPNTKAASIMNQFESQRDLTREDRVIRSNAAMWNFALYGRKA